VGLRHVYPAGADVSARQLEPAHQTVGNTSMQTIERTHRTCRTRLKRLVRTTLGFSTSVRLHDIVIGLLVNRDAFGMVS
jgi:insertion element IS1 protein InsB